MFKFLQIVILSVARSSSDDSAIRYVLPVLCFCLCDCAMTFRRPSAMMLHVITGSPNGPVLFCTLSSVGVVCRRL